MRGCRDRSVHPESQRVQRCPSAICRKAAARCVSVPVAHMKLVMGSLPGNLVPVQVFLPVGQPYAADLSAAAQHNAAQYTTAVSNEGGRLTGT
jgi:hypothetical protein